MRTLTKALSCVLILCMLLMLCAVPVFAETDPSGALAFRYAGFVASDDNGFINLNLNDALLYNESALSVSGVTVSSASVTGINENDAHFGTPICSGASVSIPVKSNTYNATRTLGLSVTYSVGGATYTQEGLTFYAKVTSGYAENYSEGNVPASDPIDSAALQSAYDITLRPTEIARDDKNHSIDIQLHLAYKGDKLFQNAPLSYFRIEPVVSGVTTEFPFKLEYSSYGRTMADVKLVTDENGQVTDTYFDFPFTVKSDAVNGYYPVTFKLYHLYRGVDLSDAAPVETVLTTYVEIRNGKKAEDGSAPGVSATDPSTAILLLEGYTLSSEEIKAGDTFDITLKIRNTSGKKVTDIKSTLTESKGTVLPVSGTSSFFIEEIGTGETVEKTLTLKAQSDAGVLPVEMTLSNAFVHENMAKTSSDSFILPVIQVVNLSLDAPNYAMEIYAGDSTNLTMKLYNKGKSMLYNVSVYLESEGLKADETYYAGNMDSGSAKTYDVMISAADGFEGQLEGNIVVSFEDSLGNVSERRSPISVNVATMDWGEDTWYDDGMMEPIEEQKKGLPWWGWAAIGLAVVTTGIGVTVSGIKRHKKKQQEKEDEDEME